MVGDASELEVLREVFLEREYEVALPAEPRFILDLGSNVGASIAFFRARYPAARIVGVEPDPRAFTRLRANVAQMTDVTVLNVAAAGVDARRSFYAAPESWLSSFRGQALAGGDEIEVETRTLESLLADLRVDRVDLLKIDVEGAEEEILPTFDLDRVGAIVGEIHPDIVSDPEGLIAELDRYFEVEIERALPDRWRLTGRGPVTNGEPSASVVIVTKDRAEEALRAAESAVGQKPPVEVLVIDDGSADGTADAVRAAFPEVRVERFEESVGYIVRRNAAAEMIETPVLVSIDDDAEFASDDVVARTVSELDDPLVGAVAIPYVDVGVDPMVHQTAPPGGAAYVTHGFRGTAYAVRRELFARLGGFREHFFHQAEEQDFCLRMLAAGRVVRLGRAEPILHHVSPKRDVDRMWFYGCRNDILFAWHNVPYPYLPARVARVAVHSLWLGIGVRRPGLFARGILAGIRACSGAERRPVRRGDYRLYHDLRKRGAVPLDEVRHRVRHAESGT